MRVIVYLNEATDKHGRHVAIRDGWKPEHPLRKTVEYEWLPASPYAEPIDALEAAFVMFNVHDASYSEVVRQYREVHRARSLSVGDVVEVDGERYACVDLGWEKISS